MAEAEKARTFIETEVKDEWMDRHSVDGSAAVVSQCAPPWIHVFPLLLGLETVEKHFTLPFGTTDIRFYRSNWGSSGCSHVANTASKVIPQGHVPGGVDWVALGFKFVRKKRKKRKHKLSRICLNTMKTTRLTFWSGREKKKKKRKHTRGRSNASCEPGGQS